MPKSSKNRSSLLVFEARNYFLVLVGFLFIVVGFTAMYLDGQFEGLVSLNVSPILILVGYGTVGYGILWRPRAPGEESQDDPS